MSAQLRRGIAALLGALLVAGALALAPAPAAQASSTAGDLAQLTAAFTQPAQRGPKVTLRAEIAAPASQLALASGALTLDLKGRNLTLRRIVLGAGAKLTITDSTATPAQAGTLTLDTSSADSEQTSALHTENAVLVVNGTAKLDVRGGDDEPAIGTDGYDLTNVGTITIGGKATVTATGGPRAAGIGGGGSGSYGAITITGQAQVTATGGAGGGAGIGGNQEAPGKTVLVSGTARVVAAGGGNGAGIGAGSGTSWSTGGGALTIASGAQVTASSGASGTAVGGGVSFGAIRVDGRLIVASGATLRIRPDGVLAGTGWLQGEGSVANQGAITLPDARVTVDDADITGNNFALTLDPAGGAFSGVTAPKAIRVLASTLLEANRAVAPNRTGWLFAGWQYTGSGAPFEPAVALSADASLEAIWKPAAGFVAAVPGYSGALPSRVGQEITGQIGSWEPGAVLRYQWLREGRAIAGATEADYTPVAADRGKRLQLRVSSDPRFTATVTKTGARLGATGYGDLVIGSPSFSGSGGTRAVGDQLWVDPNAGGWSPTTRFSYQWRIDGVAVRKATKSSFTVPASALGRFVSVSVTGTASGYRAWHGGGSHTLLFTTTNAVAQGTIWTAPKPTISGTVQVGKKLTAVPGAWSAGVTLRYQWHRDGVPVPGATKSSFTVPASAAGATIAVEVIGVRPGFTTRWRLSDPSAPVLPA